MKCTIGIDLGSTTTKAVILSSEEQVLGQGITNTRSDYDVACTVARDEAIADARLHLVGEALAGDPLLQERKAELLPCLEKSFRLEQRLCQLSALEERLMQGARGKRYKAFRADLMSRLQEIVAEMEDRALDAFRRDDPPSSHFFRDIAQGQFLPLAEEQAQAKGATFERLMGCFDRAILEVENDPPDLSMESRARDALERAAKTVGLSEREQATARERMREALEIPLEVQMTVGTGYGRQRLPFPKQQIRSEILCHGLGAHWMFPDTRTVLDIGGQDTKAIQVDEEGIVTGFQMNDRCAAGCGRYLGYVADELGLSVAELGPLALEASRPVTISSTCTVFAGAEIRDRLSAGEKREEIVAGLHRAIVLRAMSLVSRSGGVNAQFTFTGGVAKNPAVVHYLGRIVADEYDVDEINISPDSIYTGAIGAALFGLRDEEGETT